MRGTGAVIIGRYAAFELSELPPPMAVSRPGKSHRRISADAFERDFNLIHL